MNNTAVFNEAKEIYNNRCDDIHRLKNQLKSHSDYLPDADGEKTKASTLFVVSGMIAISSLFISPLLVNLADLDDDIVSPLNTILLIIGFLAISAYVLTHAVRTKQSVNRSSNIYTYLQKLEKIENELKKNLYNKQYSPNAIDYDKEVLDIKEYVKKYRDNNAEIINEDVIRTVYWISSVTSMFATACLFSRTILYELLQDQEGWLVFCIILYFVASGVALWAFYKFVDSHNTFIYSTGSFVFNIFFQTLFTGLLLVLWIPLLIAAAIAIVIGIFCLMGN